MVVLPVCAVKHGVEKTYTNACFALADGAAVEHAGACKVAK
jgi:hypothetical protein